jgi:hypothetical protein
MSLSGAPWETASAFMIMFGEGVCDTFFYDAKEHEEEGRSSHSRIEIFLRRK